jgi:predicted PurR-regulated permease PerM
MGWHQTPCRQDLKDYITRMSEANRKTTTSDRLTTVLSYGAPLLLCYLVYRITLPFLVPLAWSAVLAIFFYPVYQRVRRRLSPNLAAAACTVGVTCVLIVPVLFLALYAAREAVDTAAQLRATVTSGGVAAPAAFADLIRRHLPHSMQDLDFLGPLQQAAERVASYMDGSLAGMVKNLLAFFVNLFIVLFALFFVFRDGHQMLRSVRYLIPFEKKLQDEMLEESKDLIFASVAVALLIAAIQGFLGGVAFAITGLSAPVFLGVLTGFCSIIPVVGSSLIWIPAAAWCLFNHSWWRAILILAICGGVAGLADNFVRPMLLRNRTRLNDLLLFLSILGGLDVFGLLGLVAGPIILAAGLGVFRVYTEHADELEAAET